MKVITAMSIFNPSLSPTEDSLPSYGNEQIKILAEFYGKETGVQYAGMTYTSPPLLHDDELLSEWKIFRCALLLEKKAIMERKKESVFPSLQHILDEMETSYSETCIRRSPLGPDKLAVIQRCPAYRDHIEN